MYITILTMNSTLIVESGAQGLINIEPICA